MFQLKVILFLFISSHTIAGNWRNSPQFPIENKILNISLELKKYNELDIFLDNLLRRHPNENVLIKEYFYNLIKLNKKDNAISFISPHERLLSADKQLFHDYLYLLQDSGKNSELESIYDKKLPISNTSTVYDEIFENYLKKNHKKKYREHCLNIINKNLTSIKHKVIKYDCLLGIGKEQESKEYLAEISKKSLDNQDIALRMLNLSIKNFDIEKSKEILAELKMGKKIASSTISYYEDSILRQEEVNRLRKGYLQEIEFDNNWSVIKNTFFAKKRLGEFEFSTGAIHQLYQFTESINQVAAFGEFVWKKSLFNLSSRISKGLNTSNAMGLLAYDWWGIANFFSRTSINYGREGGYLYGNRLISPRKAKLEQYIWFKKVLEYEASLKLEERNFEEQSEILLEARLSLFLNKFGGGIKHHNVSGDKFLKSDRGVVPFIAYRFKNKEWITWINIGRNILDSSSFNLEGSLAYKFLLWKKWDSKINLVASKDSDYNSIKSILTLDI